MICKQAQYNFTFLPATAVAYFTTVYFNQYMVLDIAFFGENMGYLFHLTRVALEHFQ